MRILLIFISTIVFAFASQMSVENFKWPSGVTLLKFLEDSNIPLSLYYNLEPEDQELVSEVVSGADSQVMKDENGKIIQLLVPITDELQIHIYMDKNNEYKLIFDPIIFTQKSEALGIEIKKSPYLDIIEATGNVNLANEFMGLFKNDVNFKKIQPGDRLVILYDQKIRMGKPFASPQILASMIEENQKSHYLYYFDNKFYDEGGKKVEKFFLTIPLKYKRISSYFTPKRFHPVLKRYRAHLGVDFAAPKGTDVKSAGNGVITFVGRKNGYGNTLEINHGGGYSTLYAHLNGFAKGIKNGLSVKQGQLIAYVGNTGLSSGPHLHLGLYYNKKAIDPLKVVQISKVNVVTKEELEFKKLVKKMNEKIQNALGGAQNPEKFENFDNYISLN